MYCKILIKFFFHQHRQSYISLIETWVSDSPSVEIQKILPKLACFLLHHLEEFAGLFDSSEWVKWRNSSSQRSRVQILVEARTLFHLLLLPYAVLGNQFQFGNYINWFFQRRLGLYLMKTNNTHYYKSIKTFY